MIGEDDTPQMAADFASSFWEKAFPDQRIFMSQARLWRAGYEAVGTTAISLSTPCVIYIA